MRNRNKGTLAALDALAVDKANAIADELLASSDFLPPPIGQEHAERIARFTLHLTLNQAAKKPVNPLVQGDRWNRRWEQRDEKERAAMRDGVMRVVQALVMLGYIEL
jgi:hypothetical protein